MIPNTNQGYFWVELGLFYYILKNKDWVLELKSFFRNFFGSRRQRRHRRRRHRHRQRRRRLILKSDAIFTSTISPFLKFSQHFFILLNWIEIPLLSLIDWSMNTFISWRKVFFWSIFIINLKWLKQKLHKNFSVSGHFQFSYYYLSLQGLLKNLGHSVVSEVTDPALKVLGCRKKSVKFAIGSF